MEFIVVGLIGAAATGYLVLRGYKSIGKTTGCVSGGCEGCHGGCGLGASSSEKRIKEK